MESVLDGREILYLISITNGGSSTNDVSNVVFEETNGRVREILKVQENLATSGLKYAAKPHYFRA